MKLRAIFAVCAVAALGACSALSGGGPLGGAKPVSICDRSHFQDFLDRFSEDVQVQRTHTAFPLHKREYRHVATQMEPIPVERDAQGARGQVPRLSQRESDPRAVVDGRGLRGERQDDRGAREQGRYGVPRRVFVRARPLLEAHAGGGSVALADAWARSPTRISPTASS